MPLHACYKLLIFFWLIFFFFYFRQASCHHYHGHVCNEYLDKNKLLYLNKNPKILEESLRSPFSLLKPRLLKDCAKYALKAICLTTYPYCSSSNKPKPVRLCREDCEELQSGVCKSDFRVARQFDYLAVILPNCSILPEKGTKEAEGCVKLGIKGKVDVHVHVSTLVLQCFHPSGPKQWQASNFSSQYHLWITNQGHHQMITNEGSSWLFNRFSLPAPCKIHGEEYEEYPYWWGSV